MHHSHSHSLIDIPPSPPPPPPPPPLPHSHPIDPQLMPLSPPPPPKKRDRTTNHAASTLHTTRPAKKEKPAPVTIVYRGTPDDHPFPNPSTTALAPQTAINRGHGCHHQLTPSTQAWPSTSPPPSTVAPSYSLSHATEASLMKRKHNRLRDLCRERALLDPARELTKREMVIALLSWREANLGQRSSGFSETDDSMTSPASGYDTDDHDHDRSDPAIHERSFDDAIDPQLFSPELNPGIYNLRPRNPPSPTKHIPPPGHPQLPDTNNNHHHHHHQETIRSSAQPRTRMAIPSPFNNVHSPHSQLANYLAATGLQHDHPHHQLDPSILSPTKHAQPPAKKTPRPQPRSPRRRKPGSIRLVGTKVPSIGPIGKMSMSSINLTGAGPMPRPSPPEDLDVLLDLEDLKLSDKEIPPEKLTREHKVGSGSFKDVYMGRYRNFRVAICDLRGRLTDMDIKELGLLRDLRHPNIVRFIGVSIGGAIPCTIVTELCRNGDLYDYIRKIPCPSYVQILGLMLDAARGVEYLHLRTPSIIHRDLKSPNVLITANGSAKITDFGLARVKRDVMSMCATTCGTLNWQAPELWVAHPSYNHSIDVYALGLVFWEVLCWPFKEKTYPFQGMNEHAIFEEVGKNRLRPSTSSVRRKWGREIVALIDRMWDNSSDARPAMPEVVRLLNAMALQEREKAWAASKNQASALA
ncbi:TKL protein kinase [Puccinia triticina 1-1 BBBD Race 1]|uniref:Protein kinase domain-containing protein n=1 Tax=Puccinia triticina (isolate 1-1 / race 1 (BBBD)) TaxID=630390 RepID=A0A180GZK4_PUCT1|nr:TKL protein kinase [Puccinia triticina 1-1 BBBD Race 1]